MQVKAKFNLFVLEFKATILVVSWVVLSVLLVSCSSSAAPAIIGNPPVIKFSTSDNHKGFVVGATLNLSAEGSYDPDGEIKSYSWSVFDGMPVTINKASEETASIVISQEMMNRSIYFKLVITDNDGNTVSDILLADIRAPFAPNAQFEYDQFPMIGRDVILDGSFSHDQLQSELTYFWEQTAGSDNLPFEYLNENKIKLAVPFNLTPVEYEITLTVTNEAGLTNVASKKFTPIQNITCIDCKMEDETALSESRSFNIPGLTDVVGLNDTYALVATHSDNSVIHVNVATGEIVARYQFGHWPTGLELSTELNKVYVSFDGAEKIGVIDLTLGVSSTINTDSLELNGRDQAFDYVKRMQAVDRKLYFSTSPGGSGTTILASIDENDEVRNYGDIPHQIFVKAPGVNKLFVMDDRGSSIYEFDNAGELIKDSKGSLIAIETNELMGRPGLASMSPDGMHLAVSIDNNSGPSDFIDVHEFSFGQSAGRWSRIGYLVSGSAEFSPNSTLFAATDGRVVSLFNIADAENKYAKKMTFEYADCYSSVLAVQKMSFSQTGSTYVFAVLNCPDIPGGTAVAYQGIPNF